MPRSEGEPARGFSLRCEMQAQCSYAVHPFDASREDEKLYLRRLQAQKVKAGLGFEPGDERAVTRVVGAAPRERQESALALLMDGKKAKKGEGADGEEGG